MRKIKKDLNWKTQTIRIKPDRVNTFSKKISIRKPKLWSINSPSLYSVTVELIKNRKILDSYTTKYGLRSFNFDANKGFFLNGEHVKIKGTNNHHDGGPLGSACFDYTFERQLKILKEMGCNALRMSHNPPAPELLNCADSLGFIVIDEIFDEWLYGKVPHNYANDFNDWYKKDIADWIRSNRNHPSIIAWSLGNEIPEQKSDTVGVNLLRQLITEAEKHDRSRQFTSGCNHIGPINESGFGNALGIVGYNYAEPLYKKDHTNFPDRIIYASETVIYPYHEGISSPLRTYSEWLEGQLEDYVAGEFLWTGFDYLGESGIGMGGTGLKPWEDWPGWPWRSAVCGVVDICGFEKPGYWFRKALWSNEPVLYIAVPTDTSSNNLNAVPYWGWPKVQAHWNYKTVGEILKVQVYSNCKEVELFINGKSQGTKSLDIWEEAFLTWDVAFEPGTIEAIGKTASNEQINFKLKTSGCSSKMKLTNDKNTIKANQQDVSYCKLEMLDENGTPVPFADNLIHFSISGPGKIAALGNGDPTSHTSFKGKQMETYQGKCLAIVQSTNERGEIILTASSEGMESVSVTISCEK